MGEGTDVGAQIPGFGESLIGGRGGLLRFS